MLQLHLSCCQRLHISSLSRQHNVDSSEASLSFSPVSPSSLPLPWLLGQFRQLGLDVYRHNFSLHYPLGSKPVRAQHDGLLFRGVLIGLLVQKLLYIKLALSLDDHYIVVRSCNHSL